MIYYFREFQINPLAGSGNRVKTRSVQNVSFWKKMIFMDLGCLGPLVVDLGCVFCSVAALPRNFIGLWSVCMWLIELV